MAANLYRLDGSQALGNQLRDLLGRIGDDFAKLKTLRLAMLQMRDGDGSQAAHYALNAVIFGYRQQDGDPDDGAVAKASFEELDSFVGNGGPSLEQCCARHRQ